MVSLQSVRTEIRRVRQAILIATLALVALTGVATAQVNFPAAPVKLICDSAPGSANDVTARVLADRLSKIWGQQVVVLNAPGAGGAIAARMAASAAPDGYTLFMPVTSEFYALAGAPDVASNMPLRLERDFKSVGFVNIQPLYMGASYKARFSTMAEMIAFAKAHPGAVSYATTGRGRLTHLAMELLQKVTGAQFQMVAYNGGAAQAMPDLISGRVELVLEAYAGLLPAFKGNLIRGFGTTALKPTPAIPDIPAIADTVPGYEVTAWAVLVAPLGTPDDLIKKVNADLNNALGDPSLISAFAANGGETRQMSPAEVTAFVSAEQAKWLPVLEQAMKTAP